ncbi:3,4-dihydroxy 2-butanone 4-phosphate synthase/GTP cyclohydrolase II [Deinobacterium chartae]|uniref:Riboflavin biosynthesis protein RibBA n=1 Tax=Deinobacterium chartae TaxID=521158 RepID=A0A841I1C0_9DEIO|nr:bifunctional 3,4-dihydroxy-2-butanone-4-phosphate synthase/GTP cyclohydrolase II [Deinobacterium chartae]MBB6098230.1 3,4-dihydroxy 2-butanone 4-phosphate synthase/GTP cyclohydrolase II [Deinobacterium chartae]
MSALASIAEILDELRAGRPVVIVDDEDRENEGDLIVPAEVTTPEVIRLMAREACGLICVAITPERAQQLDLPLMVGRNTDPNGTAFTVSVDAASNSTGISAFDRADTVTRMIAPDARPEDFRRPGHIFPLVARPGGVLRRAGHTEAAVDLARLAGYAPAGVICEIMGEDGRMSRLPELLEFASRHGLKVGSIKDLIAYRLARDPFVKRVAETRLPTRHGEFRLVGYRDELSGAEHLALVMGEIGPEPTLVRVHSECLTGDALGSLRCDCGPQLDAALDTIAREGHGALVYLRQEGRGIGLLNKLRAYALQDEGADTVEANLQLGFPVDARDFGIGAQILHDLGATRLRILTNNPRKLVGLEGFGLEIVERVPLHVGHGQHNARYLEAKRTKLGHLL